MSETDAKHSAPLVLEASDVETIPVVYKGQEVRFPIIDDWPLESQTLLKSGELEGLLDLVFVDDPDGRAALRGIRIKQFKQIMEHLAELTGASLGEASSSALS